jgi:succinate-semialdehyde dehydrogenase/glutarate-semialdehyde dehydrogenase
MTRHAHTAPSDLLRDPGLWPSDAFIDGAWRSSTSGATLPVDNPATGEVIGTVPRMGAEETRAAIDAAERAFASWRRTTAKERASVLRRWSDLMIEHEEDLALLMTLEQGKPLAESRGEVRYAAGFLEWFGEEARRVYGDVIPAHQPDKRIIVLKQPIGVVGCITPWNFPLAMITRKAGPAVATGCTVVLKPASQTPLSALALAELSVRAGVPAGVFNVITGGASEIGGELTTNRKVRKISFTGSTEVGRILMAQSAPTIKKLSLELGGNAPFIVFDDADVDAAVEGAIASKYRNTGQTCVCVNRIYVQDGVYDAFAGKLTAAVAKLKLAPGIEPGATIGPLIDDRAVEHVERHVADAVEKGARILLGGHRHARGGRFFEATVLADVRADTLVAQEETFGPVAPLFRFRADDEAIELANDTEFGLAAYFYGRDLRRVWHAAERLEAGIVGVNTGLISTEVAPFGGVKQSGLGREGSKYGTDEYVEMKYLCLGGMVP